MDKPNKNLHLIVIIKSSSPKNTAEQAEQALHLIRWEVIWITLT